MDKTRILKAFADMPDEAFGYLLLAAAPSAMFHGGQSQIWPDGIGGFSDASRASITEVRAACDEYLQGLRA